MFEFAVGVAAGVVFMGLACCGKSYDELEIYDVLKGIVRTCRRSKREGDVYLTRARIILDGMEGK